MRVLVAARLSQVRKAGQGIGAQTGIESQDKLTADKLQRDGHTVVAVVADTKSGTVQPWDRPNLRKWVTDPSKIALYDAIAGYRFDRLSRGDNQSTNAIEDWAHRNGKQLLTEDGLVFPCEGADGIRWDLQKRLSHEEWLKISERYRRMQAYLTSDNKLVGRPCYGLQVIESGDHKTLAPDTVESAVISEAKTRYLAGETIDAICDDLNARHIPSPMWKGKPGKHWYAKTLAGLLRNPAIAGRRVDKSGKTVLKYDGIITWDEHLRLVKRLDSRAHRKGISPANVALLTSTLSDEAGHPLYRVKARDMGPCYYCRKGCGVLAPVGVLDAIADEAVLVYGEEPHMVPGLIPGKNHDDEIAKLRQDRNELDDLTGDYDARHAEITAEIRRLSSLPREPDEPKPVRSGMTIAQMWDSRDTAGRRDWFRENGWKFVAVKDEYGWTLRVENGEFTKDLRTIGAGAPEDIDKWARKLAELTRSAIEAETL